MVQAIALALAFGLLYVVWLLLRPLALLFAAVVVATTLEPIVDLLERRLPRVLAVVAVYLALALVVAGIGWLIVPSVTEQARTLAENAPDLVQRAQDWLNRWQQGSDARISERLQSGVGRFGTTLATLPLTLLTVAAELLLVLGMSVYWLIVKPALRRFALSLLPERQRAQASDVLSEMGRTVGGFIRGAALDGLIMAALVYVGLLILGVEYPLVLAAVVFVGELVPIVGPFVAAVPAVGIALLDSPAQAIKVAVFYAVIQQIESNIVEPNVMSKQTDMPPLLVLFALLAGGSLAGVLGALLAIPLAGALRVFVLRVIVPAVRRWTGAAGAASPP